jgi:transcriptional regulator with XRE-family HTH domain
MRKSEERKEDEGKERFLKQIGERITYLRKKQGYKNYELFAYENNISRAQYGRYEKGKDLNMSSFKKVLDALKISPVEFFKEGFD